MGVHRCVVKSGESKRSMDDETARKPSNNDGVIADEHQRIG